MGKFPEAKTLRTVLVRGSKTFRFTSERGWFPLNERSESRDSGLFLLRFEEVLRLIIVMTEQELARQLIALRDPMFRFARTLLLRDDEAEDAVADVVARLWGASERTNGCRDLRSFVLTAVRNRCYDLLRQRQAGARRAEVLTGITESTAANSVERWEARELVRTAMATLPQRQREALHLKEIEGFATKEIAAMFGTDEAQIRVLLSRARCRLRGEVEKLMNHETK